MRRRFAPELSRRQSARPNGSASSAAAPVYTPASEAGYLAWFDHTYGYAKDTGALLDGRLSLLLDRSNTYTIAQGTAGNQPLWSNTGILGRAAAYYTTDDWMSTLDATLANILDGLQAYTFYVVVDRDVNLALNQIVSLGDSASGAEFVGHRMTFSAGTSKTAYDRTSAAGNTSTIGTTGSDGGNPSRITFQFTGSVANTWTGSAADIVASANTRAPVCNRLIVGARRVGGVLSQFMDGWIGDILIYTAAHDAAARARVWAYLQTLYVGLA